MAKKISYSKLKLTNKNTETKTISYDIEVKQYLPIEEKLNMVSEIINSESSTHSGTDMKFCNYGILEVFLKLAYVEYYTNLSFTEKQKESMYKLYDELATNNIIDEVLAVIPQKEQDLVEELLWPTVQSIYAYMNSAFGILDSINTDYSNLNFDVDSLTEKLKNKENLDFLSEVLNKMG